MVVPSFRSTYGSYVPISVTLISNILLYSLELMSSGYVHVMLYHYIIPELH